MVVKHLTSEIGARMECWNQCKLLANYDLQSSILNAHVAFLRDSGMDSAFAFAFVLFFERWHSHTQQSANGRPDIHVSEKNSSIEQSGARGAGWIGNPPQSFQLVADTGSDNCIVKDCVCTQCLPEWGKACFVEPKTSKTFKVPLFTQNQYGDKKGPTPARMAMNFGSGEISAEIASDQISVGHINANLENGLLLMYDHSLEIKSHFEGILGLGRPNAEIKPRPGQPEGVKIPGFFDSAKVRYFSICFNHGADGVLGIHTDRHPKTLTSVGRTHWAMDFHGISIGDQPFKMGTCDPAHKRPEMETACSIIPDTGTTLVVGPEAQIASLYEDLCNNWQRCKNTHKDLAAEMEKLTSKGIRIEGPAGALDLVQSDFDKFMDLVSEVMARSSPDAPSLVEPDVINKARAIEDKAIPYVISKASISGEGNATGVTGKRIGKPRVIREASASKAGKKDQKGLPMTKEEGKFTIPPSMTLQLLLEHCASWIEKVDLNQEMPELKFHVADTKGNKDILQIPASSYIFSKAINVEVPSIRDVLGFPLKIRTPQNEKVCMMGFGAMDYSTELNGDVWIFGTPLFYEYTVHYDRGQGKREEINMGFTSKKETECGQCQGEKIVRSSLLDEKVNTNTQVGLEALNHLSKQPIIRNLPRGMKHV